ncbi:MAG: DUF4136 domain-containing protein [Flavobacteriaceae bacterium]|jgi:hypothetical protein|nr:DUF4136 domain-containing protein [Flavobacteriaceae bacterium]
MRNLFFFGMIALSSLWLASCASNNVSYDYDKSFDFNQLKTYSYYTDNLIQLNQIDSVNFMRTLDGVLQSKGLIRKVLDPDVYVSVKVDNAAGSKTSTLGLGVGGGSGWLGVGTSIGIPISSKVMNYAIQIDIDNAANKQLIWTTRSDKTTSYNASTDAKSGFYKTTLDVMFKNFPAGEKAVR